MSSNSLSRRGALQGAGVALVSALAGCSTGNAQSDANETGNESTRETATDHPTTDSQTQYPQVYQESIGSVVLVQTSSGGSEGGQGSGWVYRDEYVVTNAHVVSDAADVQVRFTDGEWREGSVVGVDPSSDLAVIDVERKPDYAEPLPLVESQPPIGTEVLAIGNPYGLEGSVTSGLISGVNRSIPAPNGYTIPDAIQTGAPVNPGNSGGPLVTLNGEIVGVINSGGGENLAFAISTALVNRVVPALIEDGEYDHAYLGVALQTVTPRIADQTGLDDPRGVAVTDVGSSGPSADALRSGDVIVSIGDQQVDSRQQLSSYLALQASPGETIDLTLLRDGERRMVTLTLGTRPERPDGASR